MDQPQRRCEFVALLAISALLGACSWTHPLHVEPSGLGSVGAEEGIVFGSLRVDVTPAGSGDDLGRLANKFTYLFTFPGPRPEFDIALIHDTWKMDVGPGEEHVFVARLPAGHQWVGTVRPKPFFSGAFDIHAGFRVTPGRPTYIGRLVIVFPTRLMAWSEAEVRVEDALQATMDHLAGSYAQVLAAPRSELIDVHRSRATITSDPRPAAPIP